MKPPFRCEMCSLPALALIVAPNEQAVCAVCYLPHLERQLAECRAMAECEARERLTPAPPKLS